LRISSAKSSQSTENICKKWKIGMLGGSDGSGLPVDWMDTWFMKEQIPSTWKLSPVLMD
jgi:hypothetical protein